MNTIVSISLFAEIFYFLVWRKNLWRNFLWMFFQDKSLLYRVISFDFFQNHFSQNLNVSEKNDLQVRNKRQKRYKRRIIAIGTVNGCRTVIIICVNYYLFLAHSYYIYIYICIHVYKLRIAYFQIIHKLTHRRVYV